jgi:hypothetical protein
MSKAVVCTGREREFEFDEEVTDVTFADGVTEIETRAFYGCRGLANLGFLEGSAITSIGVECFGGCTSLQSIKGWPASLAAVPPGTFAGCTGLAAVGCDISHVASVGADERGHAFAGCTSLLPPPLSGPGADPAAVLAYLKEKAGNERGAEQEAEQAARAAERGRAEVLPQAAELDTAVQAAEDSPGAGDAKKGGAGQYEDFVSELQASIFADSFPYCSELIRGLSAEMKAAPRDPSAADPQASRLAYAEEPGLLSCLLQAVSTPVRRAALECLATASDPACCRRRVLDEPLLMSTLQDAFRDPKMPSRERAELMRTLANLAAHAPLRAELAADAGFIAFLFDAVYLASPAKGMRPAAREGVGAVLEVLVKLLEDPASHGSIPEERFEPTLW